MTRFAICLAGLLLACGLGFCTREDGLPDPPVQELVPCNPDAASDDPLACPAASDDSGAAQAGVDAGCKSPGAKRKPKYGEGHQTLGADG